MLFDDYLIRPRSNLTLDSFAHQKTGDQPFEQACFVRTGEVDLQVLGADDFGH
jgi:hypothetical protein